MVRERVKVCEKDAGRSRGPVGTHLGSGLIKMAEILIDFTTVRIGTCFNTFAGSLFHEEMSPTFFSGTSAKSSTSLAILNLILKVLRFHIVTSYYCPYDET